ncbi:ATP-binding cassette domain-containing protein, partial [Tyzzerella sp. OttesenSCG-928-J15]|nr:ATP-binding cassette domain-containing protein [Tyzzerella sp. OttesenSCG-928-J15]
LRLHEPSGGEVYFKDQNVLELNKAEMKKIRTKMQMIFQDPYASLNPRMTVSQTIAQPMKINKMYGNDEIMDKVEELMATVGLAERYEDAYPHELDGGRRQRIGIARALSLNPEFIVCDEPVSALDVSIQAQILNLMMDLQDQMGLTYMFITHNLSVVKHISSEIAVMYLGQCVEKCSSKELFKNPLHPYTQALLDAIPTPVLKRNKERKIIKGEITSPINPKPGCRFAPRCPHAKAECTGGDIPFKEAAPGHFVQCVLV